MQKSGQEVFHLAFGQSPFPIPKCFVDPLKKYAHHNEYLAVAGKNSHENYLDVASQEKNPTKSLELRSRSSSFYPHDGHAATTQTHKKWQNLHFFAG